MRYILTLSVCTARVPGCCPPSVPDCSCYKQPQKSQLSPLWAEVHCSLRVYMVKSACVWQWSAKPPTSEVLSSPLKHWTHFLLSPLWPPTSNRLHTRKDETARPQSESINKVTQQLQKVIVMAQQRQGLHYSYAHAKCTEEQLGQHLHHERQSTEVKVDVLVCTH